MKCLECSGSFLEKQGDLSLPDEVLGNLTIYNVKYYRCSNCREILLPPKTAKEIEKERERRIDEIIRALPICDFVSSSEAAELLKITRQAFHKNRSIKNGLIYSATLSGKLQYVRKSVLLFGEKGNGRFQLIKQAEWGLSVFVAQADTLSYDIEWGKPWRSIERTIPEYQVNKEVAVNAGEN
jgi:hypothetical protein